MQHLRHGTTPAPRIIRGNALGPVLTQEKAGEVTRYLETKPCFNAHIAWMGDNVPRRIGDGAEAFHYGSYQLADILAAPYLIEIANRPDIPSIAEGYLGCTRPCIA